MIEILANPKFLPVVGCVCFYTFLLLWFLFHKDYAYAWYWFSAANITIASVVMAARG
jgi:hypothetical protein